MDGQMAVYIINNKFSQVEREGRRNKGCMAGVHVYLFSGYIVGRCMVPMNIAKVLESVLLSHIVKCGCTS